MLKYPLKFKGLVLYKKKDIRITNIIFKGPLKRGQILVKVLYSGICGKQIEEYVTKMGKDPYLPHLLGHEASGIVLDIGSSVKNVKIGDKIVLHWVPNQKGILSETPKFYDESNNKRLNAGLITTFSENTVVSSNRVTKINSFKHIKISALLGCCLSTGLGVVFNQSSINKKDNAVVIGCGGVGLSVILGLKIAGVKNILAIDQDIKNLIVAKKIGAKMCKKYNFSKTYYKKYNKIFICSGHENSFKIAINFNKADIYFLGVPAPRTNIIIDALNVHRGLNLIGSSGGSIIPHLHIPKYLNYIKRNPTNFYKIISKTINLKDAPEIIRKMSLGTNRAGRNIIKF
jgi:S-(hydroxymethyl)glutathione dehydrogenase/alcohol dehydrogenase